jgi:hypothetical protein
MKSLMECLTEYLNGCYEAPERGKEMYHLRFIGRKLGSIGKTYYIEENIDAESEEKAWLKLYDKYEHIIPKREYDKIVLNKLYRMEERRKGNGRERA